MWDKIKHLMKGYWSVFFVGLFFICTMAFLIIRNDTIYVHINDLLDSNIMWSKVKRDVILSGRYGKAHVPFLRGDESLDRLLKISLSPADLIYCLLPPFYAYVFCFYARIVISILGWKFMANSILPKDQFTNNFNIIIFCGFLYGIIPVWPVGSGTFGFAVLPWILTDFILIYKTGKWKYCFWVILIPFWTGLSLFGIFICGYLLIFMTYDTIKNKKINVKILFAFILLCSTYLLNEYEKITQVTTNSTIYDNIKRGQNLSLKEFIGTFMFLLKNGRYHSGDCHSYVVFPVCIIGIIIINILHVKKKDSLKIILLDAPNLIFFWIIFSVFIDALWNDSAAVSIICRIFPLLKGLNLSRTSWFTPFAWYLCFFILMIRLKQHYFLHLANVLCLCAFGAICLMGESNSLIVMYNDISTNLEFVLHECVTGEKPDRLTWRETYSEDLFENIKNEIDYKGEWSIAFGFQPAILNYNEINTLDGYYSGYSKEYKEQFAMLIRPYLESGSENVDYFNSSGIRAYIFSDEADYSQSGRYFDTAPCDMLIDADVFREMGGKYVFSRVPISNFKQLRFQYIKCFVDEDSPYKIYVYCIDDIDEYSCAMKSHFRKSGNQMSGKWKSSYASLLA